MNASDERKLESIRTKVKQFARTAPVPGTSFKVIFADEADALTPDAQGALRRIMEQNAQTCRFILSCNYSSKIIEPIQSHAPSSGSRPLADDQVRSMVVSVADGRGNKSRFRCCRRNSSRQPRRPQEGNNFLAGHAASMDVNVTREIVYETCHRSSRGVT